MDTTITKKQDGEIIFKRGFKNLLNLFKSQYLEEYDLFIEKNGMGYGYLIDSKTQRVYEIDRYAYHLENALKGEEVILKPMSNKTGKIIRDERKK